LNTFSYKISSGEKLKFACLKVEYDGGVRIIVISPKGRKINPRTNDKRKRVKKFLIAPGEEYIIKIQRK